MANLVGFTFTSNLNDRAMKVERLGWHLKSYKEPLTKAVKEVIIPSIRTNFDVGGRPAWAPLSDSTLKQNLNGTILHRTGALQTGATRLNIWTIDTKQAIVQDLPDSIGYGKVHQWGYGGNGAPGKISASERAARAARLRNALRTGTTIKTQRKSPDIPARPFMMIQPEDGRAIGQIFDNWLDQRILETFK